MKTKKSRPYEFDAAISYAGEDRLPAERVAKALKAKGYSIFYARDSRADLWGKRQAEYEQIYGPKSRFVIPFISKDYARKDWTRFEFESAKREAERREGEFILPIRIDDARLLGLTDDVNYLPLGDLTINDVVDDFVRKCGMPVRNAQKRAGQPCTTRRVDRLLSTQARTALGILATSRIPATVDNCRKVFPDVDWPAYFRAFSQSGFITPSGNRVHVSHVVKRFFENEPDIAEFHKRWVAALAPIGAVDTAVFLAAHYLHLGSLGDAVHALADATDGTSLGDWNDVYLSVWSTLAAKHVQRRMSPETRCRLYNSLGICLSTAGKYEEALKWFTALGTASRSGRNVYWVGQSLINRGVAYWHLGQFDKATILYRKAIEQGKATGDNTLVARSMGNLAQLIMASSPEEAAALISDSLGRKRQTRDHAGLAIGYAQLGELKATLGRPEQAIEHFTVAKNIAKRLGMRETLALSLYDLATAWASYGRKYIALSYYRRAFQIAAEDGYGHVQTLAATGEGRVCFELRRYAESMAAFRRALKAAEARDDTEATISSLHALGVLLRLRGRFTEARGLLTNALRLAGNTNNTEWIVRCLTDNCRRVVKGEFRGFEQPALRRAAVREWKGRRWESAGRMWDIYAEESRRANAAPAITHRAFVRAINCLSKTKDCGPGNFEVLCRFYIWLWQNREYAQALDALRRAESVGRMAHLPGAIAKAVDERGVCLQYLNRHQEAVRSHLRAVRMARKCNDGEQLVRSLNNLGEALRKVGDFGRALAALQEAERLALGQDDYEGRIVAAGNRALVLLAGGEKTRAAKLLRRCRRWANRRKLWSHALGMSARLAECLWEQGRIGDAQRLFGSALSEARRRKQPQALSMIALSYARFLLSLGDAHLALRVLRPCEAVFSGAVDAYLFHYTLGEIYRETKDVAFAKKHWRLAKLSAEAAGNADYVAICAAGLAEVYEAERKLDVSEDEVRVALEREPEPMGRALLLTQLLRVQLAAGHSRRAEKTFYEARSLAEKHGFQTVYADIHVMVATDEWKKPRAHKLSALKAYIIAMLKALEMGPESWGQLVGDFVLFLTRPELAPSERLLTRLTRALEEWASREITKDPDKLRFVLWPVTLLKKLLPFVGRPQQLADEVKRLVKRGEFLPETGHRQDVSGGFRSKG
jgi:tetratricopeptide (TPR) repeat protein